MTDQPAALLEVDNLSIEYGTRREWLRAADEVSFAVNQAEVVGLVGESGSGKSTVAMALLGHVGANGRVAGGRILFRGEDILRMAAPVLATRRGRHIGVVPQNPATALSPHLRVGAQLAELALWHGIATSRASALALAREQFAAVGLPEPGLLLRRYPHELSGGQLQRVCIAMAISCRPELLVLDEPTTGLDVTTQATIIDLLKDLRRRLGMAMVYVTHDLGVLSQIADRVGVMYAGRLVESASVERLFTASRHPYSRGLMASVPTIEGRMASGRGLRGLLHREELPAGCPFFPRCDRSEPSCSETPQRLTAVEPDHWVACQRWWATTDEPGGPIAGDVALPKVAKPDFAPLLALDHVRLSYRRERRWRRWLRMPVTDVVADLSLTVAAGEIFALVGESGSGKSTIARAASGQLVPVAGTIRFRGAPVPGRLRNRPLELKRQIQYIFQNPDASLNPRARIGKILARPLRHYFRLPAGEVRQKVEQALHEVRLDPSYVDRYPAQLSGGERQRVAIAGALIAQPSLMLCDEVLSALDVSVQANVLDLLNQLRRETGVAMLFISHDLAVVRHLADRVGVLFRGTLVELALTEALFEPPYHPYAEELLLAVPSATLRARPARPQDHTRLPRSTDRGCVYASRCVHHRGAICDEQPPPWRQSEKGQLIRCHIDPAELSAVMVATCR